LTRQVKKDGKHRRGVQRYRCTNTQCTRPRFIVDRYRAPTPAAYMRAYRRRQKIRVYHRSRREDWGTPQTLFDQLHAEFRFTLDVCASPENTKCARYFTRQEDGLAQAWAGEVCWMNPPYGRGVAAWVRKAYESAQAGATVVCLLKATPDTQWWHIYVPYAEVRFLPGRLTFAGSRQRAPFPSALVIFRPPGGPQTLHQEEIVGWWAS
jgi:site-specific DNA-methyltransferase (adenine-specific)